MPRLTRPTLPKRIAIPPVGPVVQIACVAAALLLALHGFWAAYAAIGVEQSFAKIALHSVRLIVGSFPDALENRDVPATLTIARYALPLLTTWTTVALAWKQLRNPFRLWRIKARGDHLVLAGDEGLAQQLARAELTRGRKVLVWHDDARARWIGELTEAGAAFVERKGDDTTPALALGKARAVLLIAHDDAANAALAMHIVDAARKLRPAGDPLDVIVRVDDLDLRQGIERRFDRSARGAARVRFASLPDLAARQLFTGAPLDGFRRDGDAQRLVLLLGFTAPVERYVRRLLAGSHFRDGIRPRFVVGDADPVTRADAFRHRNPGADSLSPLVFEKAPIDRAANATALVADLIARHGEPIAIVVDCGDDSRTLALGLGVADHYAQADRAAPPIHVRLDADRTPLLGTGCFAFGSLDHFADPELLLQEDHDSIARSIHDFYLQGRIDEGEAIGARASMHEWEDLPEGFRDDNRLVADCYQLKLRDIDARVTRGAGPPLRLDDATLEELSRAEHDRWLAAKLSDGWVFGETRDDANKRHPDIVDYDALSEKIKDLDREQVRAMTRLLSVAGHRALRTLTVAIDPACDGAVAALPALNEILATHYPDRIPLYAGTLADAAPRAALIAAAALGAPVLVALDHNADRLLDQFDPDDRAAATALIRNADTILVAAGIAARADLRLTATAAQEDRSAIVVTQSGEIARAPWTA